MQTHPKDAQRVERDGHRQVVDQADPKVARRPRNLALVVRVGDLAHKDGERDERLDPHVLQNGPFCAQKDVRVGDVELVEKDVHRKGLRQRSPALGDEDDVALATEKISQQGEKCVQRERLVDFSKRRQNHIQRLFPRDQVVLGLLERQPGRQGVQRDQKEDSDHQSLVLWFCVVLQLHEYRKQRRDNGRVSANLGYGHDPWWQDHFAGVWVVFGRVLVVLGGFWLVAVFVSQKINVGISSDWRVRFRI